jgi:hypothetical protein
MYNYKEWLTRGNRQSKILALELKLDIEREFIGIKCYKSYIE